MSTSPSRRDDHSEATRRALLRAARQIFATLGYQGTAVDAVAHKARVTKGALYHHFAGKSALFDAVVCELQDEVASGIDRRVENEPDRWRRLKVGIAAFLDACGEPSYRRLVIHEAPAVLGMARFREIDDAALAGFHRAIAALRDRGDIDFPDPALLTRLLAALVWETAMLMAEARDPAALRRDALAAIERTLHSFRKA